MAQMTMQIEVAGLGEIKALTAALEQYNAKAEAVQVQYEACAADYKATREQCAEEVARAVCILRGEPVGPRDPGQPISVLESAALDASNLIEALREALKAERVAVAKRDMEIDALRSERGLMQHSIDTWRDRTNDLQQKIDAAAPREPEVKRIAALKERLAAANATICELARDNTELREEVASAEESAGKLAALINNKDLVIGKLRTRLLRRVLSTNGAADLIQGAIEC